MAFCSRICRDLKESLLILSIIIIYGTIRAEIEAPIIKMKPNEILEKNPRSIFGIIFGYIIIVSLHKVYSIFKINRSKNNSIESPNNNDYSSNMKSKLSFLGRIIYTILSLEVLFFFYNFVVQSILLFPGPLYDMENKFFKSIFFVLYFLFIIFSPIVLIIPTYEFISFPYLFFNDPYCHLKSFKYIGTSIRYEEEEYNIIDDNLNKSFMNWGFLFFALFLIGLFTDALSDFKDGIEFCILVTNFIHYITIFLLFPFFYN